MKKKILFYFLTALIVLTLKTNSSHSAPTVPNGGASSEHTRSMPPFLRKYVMTNNTINAVKERQDQPNTPIGKLFIEGVGTCTASVINTSNGNVGVTAAHCLFEHETGQYYNNIRFSPGFDNGNDGPFGQINVVQAAVPIEYQNNNDDRFDYGMIRFDFNRDGHPLQYFTGSLGYRFDLGNNVPTTIRGYPDDPDGVELPNCPNDGTRLCTWQGQVNVGEENNQFYVVPDLEIGIGASGAPLIWNWDPNTNLGWFYSNYISFDELNDQAEAPIYDLITFQGLIGAVTLPH